MKKILIFLVFILSFLNASHISWYSNYDKAHEKALKENKILMVYLIEDNCFLCKEMLKNTFQNQPYIEKVNEKFISVIVIKNQTQSYPIEMLYTMVYPAVFFLNAQELFIGENIFGYTDPKAFQKHLDLYFKLF